MFVRSFQTVCSMSAVMVSMAVLMIVFMFVESQRVHI